MEFPLVGAWGQQAALPLQQVEKNAIILQNKLDKQVLYIYIFP